MKDQKLFIEKADQYIDQTLSKEEREAFEKICQNDTEAQALFEEHSYIRQQLTKEKENRAAEAFIKDGGNHWKKQTKTKTSDKNRVLWKAVAIAASIAILFSITALWQVYKHSFSSQNSSFIALRREINDIKKSQKDLLDGMQSDDFHNNTQQFGGTGFALSTNGYIATNAHVINGADSIEVITNAKETYKAQLVYKDPKYDLAILKITDSSFLIPTLPFELGDTAALGEGIYTLGFPRNEIVYGKGYISAITGFEGDSSSYQLSLPVNPGSSGGPVFDKNGKILGIISGKESSTDNIAFAIRSSYLVKMTDSIPKDLPKPMIECNSSSLGGMNRVQQLEKLKNYVFLVKAYR